MSGVTVGGREDISPWPRHSKPRAVWLNYGHNWDLNKRKHYPLREKLHLLFPPGTAAFTLTSLVTLPVAHLISRAACSTRPLPLSQQRQTCWLRRSVQLKSKRSLERDDNNMPLIKEAPQKSWLGEVGGYCLRLYTTAAAIFAFEEKPMMIVAFFFFFTLQFYLAILFKSIASSS